VKAWKTSQKLRSNGKNQQTNGKKIKEDIKENVIKITEEEKKKRQTNLIKGLKRHMETQSKRISSNNATAENRMKAREELLFLTSSLNKIGNETLEKEKNQPKPDS